MNAEVINAIQKVKKLHMTLVSVVRRISRNDAKAIQAFRRFQDVRQEAAFAQDIKSRNNLVYM